jgi:hypothetical protein
LKNLFIYIPAKINIKKFTNGLIKAQIIETPVNMPNKMSPIKICGPYVCNCITNCGFLRIIIPEKICDPSSGGIGIILKTAKDIFI